MSGVRVDAGLDCLPSLTTCYYSYVGLANLGCTCYMNATLQQFFTMPDFRRGVFGCEVAPPNTVMHELQRMFGYLQGSARKAYNPQRFTQVLVDDGAPTDPNVQKDASEYVWVLVGGCAQRCLHRDAVQVLDKHVPAAGHRAARQFL